MKILRTLAIILAACGVQLSAHATVTATLNRSQIASGESVQLLLQQDGQTDTQPDLSPLAQDFKVLATSTGSNVQIVNGQVSAKTEVQVSLIPNHDGKLQIPPLHWGNDNSPPLDLSVGGTGSSNQKNVAVESASNHVFFDVALDHKPIYVNGAILLNLRLHTDQMLSEASLDLPSNSDVQVQQIGKDRQTTEIRDGHEFQVVERQYVLLPQRSGHLTLNGAVLNAQVTVSSNEDPFAGTAFANDSFFKNVFSHMQIGAMLGAKRPFHLQGKSIELDVQPRPSQVSAKDWLPSGGMTLDGTVTPNGNTIQQGEPLTLHLHLSAEGTTASQLPDLATMMSLPDGIKAYPDQPRLDTKTVDNRLLAVRDQDVALIANRAGKFTLPAIRVPFWDVSRNVQRYVDIAPRTLDVVPSTAGTSTAPPIMPNSSLPIGTVGNQIQPVTASLEDHRWRLASAGFSALWLATVCLWWRDRRASSKKLPLAKVKTKASKTDNISSAMKAFQRAVDANDALASRKNLLAWSQLKWPIDSPVGLRSLANKFQDPILASLLNDLDRACYADVLWNGEELARAVKAWRDPEKGGIVKQEIGGLYA